MFSSHSRHRPLTSSSVIRRMAMLALKSFPFLHHPSSSLIISTRTSFPKLPLRRPLLSTRATATATSPSTRLFSSSPSMSSETVEHIVLFAVKPGTEPDAMVSNLRSLATLDPVQHLTAGSITLNRSASHPAFTHLLHSRYRSKSDLAAYAAHPSHVAVVKEHVLPTCDDILAIDWLVDLGSGPIVPSPGSVMRVTLLKPKEGAGAEERAEILRVVGGVKDLFPGLIDQISFGENFSPARAKGFDLACVAFLPGPKELEALDAEGHRVETEKEKVRHLLEGVIVVDYVIPSPPNANL